MLFAAAAISTSCNKWFEGVNDNPNDPIDVPVSVLIPSIEGSLAYGVGGDASRYVSVFMQHCEGATRQFTAINAYQLSENDVDNFWRFNLYAGPLNDLHILNTKAEAEGYHEYAGVAKILMAYGLSVATDLFGDVPYSEAFQGADNLTPIYDTQQELYTTIMPGLLNQGIADLNNSGAAVVPGDDDLIYGGDVQKWIQLANTLKARLQLHTKDYSGALATLNAGDVFTGNGDDFTFYFGTTQTSANPWFQYVQQRDDIRYTTTLSDMMASISDPRFDAYFDTTNGASDLGPWLGSINSPVEMATYVEMKFIQAEAAFQTGDKTTAADAHNEAIKASLAKVGVVDLAFEAAEASETAGTITLDKIMTHKYIALFLQPEVWTDFRRTDLPALTAVPVNVTSNVIPTRFPYPQSEVLYNPNTPPSLSITTKVWWDL
ncbi:MAG: SusD/RagB family nutrient-binding outer membrane lipoprotein [Bacteroidia bacterium]|nr:SusD/RagB family nutrient-binding outer membrane lipoprotein [Bacteroidia bacterium]